MSTIIQTAGRVPKPVRKALKASRASFDPAGTAVLFPEHTNKPDLVVIWRKGVDAMAEVEALLPLAQERQSRIYIAFECQRLWDEWCRTQSAQH